MVNKTPREIETREETKRPTSWKPPSVLPTPDTLDGYVYRWIRTHTLGHMDTPNMSSKMRQGWVPVRASDHPEITVLVDRNSRYPENIEIGGLILCKLSRETAEERNRYYSELAAKQLEAVDNNYMRENRPEMPLLRPDRKSRVKFGKNSREE